MAEFPPGEQPSPAETLPNPPDSTPVLKRIYWRILRRDWRMIALLAAALLLVAALVIGAVVRRANHAMSVTVIIASDALQTETRAGNVAGLLSELGIALTATDVVTPPLETPLRKDMVVRIDKTRSVALSVDGDTYVFWTAQTQPADILASVDVEVNPRDRLTIDGVEVTLDDLERWSQPVRHITLRHASPIRINDNGTRHAVQTTSETVGAALFAAGFTLYLADEVTPPLHTPITPGLDIAIRRSLPVTIIADGQQLQTRTQGATVADVLADAGMALAGLDYPRPSEDTLVTADMVIAVLRVREALITEETELPFDTSYRADPTRHIGQVYETQAGRPGLQRVRLRVRYENNIQVAQTIEDIDVVREPVGRVVTYGTQGDLRPPSLPRHNEDCHGCPQSATTQWSWEAYPSAPVAADTD